jgi:xanthine dehydrogenase molybdopterin-binding subunit B
MLIKIGKIGRRGFFRRRRRENHIAVKKEAQWWSLSKMDRQVKKADIARVRAAAAGYYHNPALAMSSEKFETPFQIFARNQNVLCKMLRDIT